jgi:SulP family sulfate permease
MSATAALSAAAVAEFATQGRPEFAAFTAALAGVAVLRVEGGLFFANAEHVRAAVRAHVDEDTKAVVLDAQTTPFIDVSAARMLRELARDLQRDGVAFVIARGIGQVRDVLRSEDADALVEVHTSVQDAVDAVTDAPAARR